MFNSSLIKISLLSFAMATAFHYPITQAAGSDKSVAEEEGFNVNFRWRLEHIDQDTKKLTNASTLRTRINYFTNLDNGFSFFIEVDNVSNPFTDNYNSTSNGKTKYATVADPTGTDLNQLWVRYQGLYDTEIKLGKQKIIYDNQRFVGAVGWRQNEQTFDSLKIDNTSFEDITLSYSYIETVNTIFDPDFASTRVDSDTHLFNLSYSGWDYGNLSVYNYFIGNDETPTGSLQTFGVRLASDDTTKTKPWGYELEFADQSDFYNNPNSVSADYFHVSGSYKFSAFKLTAGLEVLSGDKSREGNSFQTPLATKHIFNGYADKFLTTPDKGLEDVYVKASTKFGDGYKLEATWHNFSPEAGGEDYGDELDIKLVKKISKNIEVLFKYVDYNKEKFSKDTTKYKFMLTASF